MPADLAVTNVVGSSRAACIYIYKYIYIGGAIIARLVGVKLGLRFYGTYMGSL